MSELEGRTVLVTGGSMGIGFACARELLARGANVFIAARQEVPLQSALKQLDELASGRVAGATADVGDSDAVDRLFAKLVPFGSISGVVHAAGVYGPIGPLTTIDPDAWLRAVRVNLFGTFLITRAACRAMTEANGAGSIVLLAGGGAATPFPNYTAYASSKVAVVRFAESVALEMAATRIRINAVAPGFVATRLHQETIDAGEQLAGAFLEATREKLANAVPASVAASAIAFLISDRSSGITGKFVAAPYDDWATWPEHLVELQGTDLFTLRRIVPRDRGIDWR